MKYNIDNIPIDVGEFTKTYDNIIPYTKFEYFGKCNDQYVINRIFGNATTMWNFICSCKIVDMEEVVYKIKISDGEKKLPNSFINNYNKIKKTNNINNYNYIVCGINDYQKISFIYITETDIHYFFDCK